MNIELDNDDFGVIYLSMSSINIQQKTTSAVCLPIRGSGDLNLEIYVSCMNYQISIRHPA